MKPAPFDLKIPHNLDEALALLADIGDEAKVIAGGQSLVPMLNLRLARPGALIDIHRLAELCYIRRSRKGGRIGALTRHAMVERSPLIRSHWPILAEGIGHVAHPQIRNRGTIGGSLSHADPSAELPTLIAALDATLIAASATKQRAISWPDFFLGPFETALEPDELLIEIQLPPTAPGTGSAFTEYARRAGDYAIGGAAVVLSLDGTRRVTHAALALLGAPGSPVRAHDAENLLTGSQWNDELPATAAAAAVAKLSPPDTVHGSGSFKRRIIRTQVEAALRLAAARAKDVL